MKYRPRTLLEILWEQPSPLCPHYSVLFFSFCKTSHLAAPQWWLHWEPERPLQVDDQTGARFTQQPSLSLAVFRALSRWYTFVERARGRQKGKVCKRKSLEAENKSKWGSKKCKCFLGLPGAFTFLPGTPLPCTAASQNRHSTKPWISLLD